MLAIFTLFYGSVEWQGKGRKASLNNLFYLILLVLHRFCKSPPDASPHKGYLKENIKAKMNIFIELFTPFLQKTDLPLYSLNCNIISLIAIKSVKSVKFENMGCFNYL